MKAQFFFSSSLLVMIKSARCEQIVCVKGAGDHYVSRFANNNCLRLLFNTKLRQLWIPPLFRSEDRMCKQGKQGKRGRKFIASLSGIGPGAKNKLVDVKIYGSSSLLT